MANKEQFLPLEFPEKGLNLSVADIPTDESVDPGLTTDIGQNVRFFEGLTGRGRGGQRPGLSRYINERVNGVGAIQHLNTVVRTDGNALDWAFQAQEFKDTGLYLGLDLTDPVIGGEQPTGGGGGFQPSESFSDNRVRLAVSVDDSTQPINGTAVVTGTVTDSAGNPLSGQRVRIITSRGGAAGDELQGVTGAGGTVDFEVTSDRAETVKYMGAVIAGTNTPVTRSRNAVRVTYGGITLVQSRISQTTLSTASRDLAFTSDVAANNLLLCAVGSDEDTSPNPGVTITDSLGNTWTRIDAFTISINDFPTQVQRARLDFYYAVANGPGTCTVTSTLSSGTQRHQMALLEYSGVSAAPLTGESSKSGITGTSQPMSTNSVTVTTADSLLIGVFYIANNLSFSSDLVADAGFTELLSIPQINTGSMYVFAKMASADEAVTGTCNFNEAFAAIGASFKP